MNETKKPNRLLRFNKSVKKLLKLKKMTQKKKCKIDTIYLNPLTIKSHFAFEKLFTVTCTGGKCEILQYLGSNNDK